MRNVLPTVSVVIPAYNEEKTLGSCLDSLVKQNTKIPFEVIVVDNNSTDKTVEIVKTYVRKLDLTIIKESKKGRGPARQAGFAAAAGDIIFSTDADTSVPVNWLEKFSHICQNPGVAVVTGTYRITDLSPLQNTCLNILQPAAMTLYRICAGHFWLSGFNFAIKKNVYQESGGFDARLTAHEDIDLGFRVVKLGKIAFVPNTPVVVSGRRYKQNFWRGAWAYIKTTFEFVRYRQSQPEKIHLTDVR